MDTQAEEQLRLLVAQTLHLIGENPQREGLLKTPERVAKCLAQLTGGYAMNPTKILRSAIFREQHSQMVVVRDMEFYSLCEHHILPFFGKAHIGYIPNGTIVGLSKLPRMVDAFARRLQVQERLTAQIAQCIDETLQPKGVIVVLQAQHLCMQMRGVEKQGAITQTIDYRGLFEQPDKRSEFLALLRSDN